MLHTTNEAQKLLINYEKQLKEAKRKNDKKMNINFIETCIACLKLNLEESQWI